VGSDIFNVLEVSIPNLSMIRESGRPKNKHDEPAISITIQIVIDFTIDTITESKEMQ
jgi:hypothetical protein